MGASPMFAVKGGVRGGKFCGNAKAIRAAGRKAAVAPTRARDTTVRAEKVVGIDLGTTNSAVRSHFTRRQPAVSRAEDSRPIFRHFFRVSCGVVFQCLASGFKGSG
jgi:hypothetical protein